LRCVVSPFTAIDAWFSLQDFPDYPELLREAISVARRLRDPLTELSQLCNADEDLLCIHFHPMQVS